VDPDHYTSVRVPTELWSETQRNASRNAREFEQLTIEAALDPKTEALEIGGSVFLL
jgi:hypothetical protein